MVQEHEFHYAKDFELEVGKVLKGFTLKYCTFGTPKADGSNIIWVCHALTGNANVLDWWGGLFGEGKFFNPKNHFVICANILGSCYGSTGPLSINPETGRPYYHSFPLLTIRDMVRALDLLRQHLGIQHINTLIGGSLGGQQALEWAIMRPDLVENLILIATNIRHSPWGIAFNESQRLAIEADPTWREERPDAGAKGMKAARAIAMLSYRNYETYQKTQLDEDNNKLDNFRASTYQAYQGDKLVRRFNAFSYWTLSKAMDTHNIARGRASAEEVLRTIQAYTQVVSITTDVLFPVQEQRLIVRYLKNVTYEEIHSTYGHDGFLVEFQKLERAFSAFFKQKAKKKLFPISE
ncbi:MAG: homoserine O-acetyltransferase [Flammeovirgaceae bacterium]|nr:homoserine O-acetyltransferase [Flammeovirgaceae bacterium]